MKMTHRMALVALLTAPALHACNCDDVLTDEPKPDAILAHETHLSPPDPNLDVAMPPAILGNPVTAQVELRNPGTAPLAVSEVRLSSDTELCPQASANFIIAEPVPAERRFELAAGAKRSITVRFTPSSGAAECVVLLVQSNDEDHPALKARFTGRGDAPRLCADRVRIDFGEVQVGNTNDDVVELRSCGTRAIELLGLSTNGFFPPFSHDNVVMPVILEPEQVLQVPVHFAPAEAGIWTESSGRAGIITIAATTGEVYQLTLVGTSRMPPACVVDVAPAALNFGVVVDTNPRMLDVVITNRGERDCVIHDAAVDPAGVFSAAFVPSFSAGGTLEPNSVATVRVTMTPPGSTGVFNAMLNVTSDDPVRPAIAVPLEVNLPGEQPCLLTIDPTTVSFGTVPLNTLRTAAVTLTNAGEDTCFVSGVSIEPGSNPAFVNTSGNFSLIQAGASKQLTVSFRPTTAGTATGRLKIRASDAPFGGASVDYFVQLIGRTGNTNICVEPRHLDFGVVNGTATRDFTISACGATTINVSAVEWTSPDAEFTLVGGQPAAFSLVPGAARTITVSYTPADAAGDTAALMVRSDDAVNPAIPVDMTGGPETVPPSAGRYLYYWQIPSPVGGDVMKFPLQGSPTAEPFYGPRTGKNCAGCHSVSPDGKYVAVLEFGFLRFVEADTGFELVLDHQFADPQYFSWRPNTETNPPYQFAYGTDNVVKIAALFDGYMRDLQGANDSAYMQTMPTWGTNGTIAFVRGQQAPQSQQGSATGFQGPTDIMIVDEDGGSPTLIAGASANGMANYYPAFSPNARWLAFTQSASAQSTIAATDAQLRLVRADGSGQVLALDLINGADGATSYPTWAVDGTFLSFSSDRSGGRGDWDIYVAPVDPLTGAEGVAQNVTDLNTAAFEHAAQWSP